MLHKLLAIFLLAVHGGGNTELGQLLKLPALLSHYYEHHRNDPAVDFVDFIVMHYAGNDGTAADDAADQQLPCHNPQHTSFAVAFAPMVKELPAIKCCGRPGTGYSGFLPTAACCKHVFLHLQPPRVV